MRECSAPSFCRGSVLCCEVLARTSRRLLCFYLVAGLVYYVTMCLCLCVCVSVFTHIFLSLHGTAALQLLQRPRQHRCVEQCGPTTFLRQSDDQRFGVLTYVCAFRFCFRLDSKELTRPPHTVSIAFPSCTRTDLRRSSDPPRREQARDGQEQEGVRFACHQKACLGGGGDGVCGLAGGNRRRDPQELAVGVASIRGLENWGTTWGRGSCFPCLVR